MPYFGLIETSKEQHKKFKVQKSKFKIAEALRANLRYDFLALQKRVIGDWREEVAGVLGIGIVVGDIGGVKNKKIRLATEFTEKKTN